LKHESGLAVSVSWQAAYQMQWHVRSTGDAGLNESVSIVVGNVGNYEGGATYLIHNCFLGMLPGQILPQRRSC
jgi:hypothetical protein